MDEEDVNAKLMGKGSEFTSGKGNVNANFSTKISDNN